MGGPAREPGEALAALREATALIRAFWSGRTPRQEGAIYRAVGARPGPLPAHEIGLWLGVLGPRALRLVGELGDGWVPSMSYVPPVPAARSTRYRTSGATLVASTAAERRIYNVGGSTWGQGRGRENGE
jgi:alkanesulfonate monooxygenase SsuD/methylene tetrahydromethanopterin reductase-like flavin-dependent oxidoreductase (luciferase family)